MPKKKHVSSGRPVKQIKPDRRCDELGCWNSAYVPRGRALPKGKRQNLIKALGTFENIVAQEELSDMRKSDQG